MINKEPKKKRFFSFSRAKQTGTEPIVVPEKIAKSSTFWQRIGSKRKVSIDTAQPQVAGPRPTQKVSNKKKARRRLIYLSLQDQILFTRRLSILLKAGVPIFESLRMMRKHMTSRSASILVEELLLGVERGQFLHASLEPYRKSLGEFTLNIIRIGETTGMLPENLLYLAEELEKKKQLRNKVRSALIYPAVLVVATVGIVVMLTTYIFPKILPILQGFKGELPFTTRTLIFVSNFLTQNGIATGISILGIIILLFFLSKITKVRYALHWTSLRIPILGNLFKYYHIANFCRTLGLLMRSDVRILEAITITAQTNTNLVYRKSLLELVEIIKKGGKFSAFLERDPQIYPPMVSQMITVGEVSGKLSESLLYLADIYEKEIDDITKNFSSTIEPVLMIVMGVVVGFVAISIISPIYQLTQNLRP